MLQTLALEVYFYNRRKVTLTSLLHFLVESYAPANINSEKEYLAVLESVDFFREYIELQQVVIYTDHYSLQHMMSMTVTSGRLARWILRLQPYVGVIKHRPGKLMQVPDALSRAPLMHSDSLLSCDSLLSSDWYEETVSKVKMDPGSFPKYKLSADGEILSYRIGDDDSSDWRVIPPPCQTSNLIRKAHLDILHGGIDKTLHKVREKYVWYKMKWDIQLMLRNCYECAVVKASNQNLSGMMGEIRTPKCCFHTLSLDIKHGGPEGGPHHLREIIVVQECLSRFLFAKAVCVANASKIVDFLASIISKYGIPRFVIHDNGTQFYAHEFLKFLQKHGIRSMPTSIYTPQCNPVERANRSIGEGLRFAMLDKQDRHYL
jgi:Integrase zinc binding domain/RNase H-like domain found in reverse transcriptase